MTTNVRNKYWRGTIFAPVLGAMVGYLLPAEYALWMYVGFIFVAIPYVPFAALMWWLVGRTQSTASSVRLALAAPIIFLPFFAAFAALPLVSESWARWVSMMTGYVPVVLAVAYSYVALCLLGFLVVSLVVSRSVPKELARPVV